MKIYYTVHSKQRMSLRAITHKEVLEALENGICYNQPENKIECIYNNVRVIFTLDQSQGIITIVTVIHSKPFNKQVTKYSRKNKVSKRQAAIQLKQSQRKVS